MIERWKGMLCFGAAAMFVLALLGMIVLQTLRLAGLVQPNSGWHFTEGVLALFVGATTIYLMWRHLRSHRPELCDLRIMFALHFIAIGCIVSVVNVVRVFF